MLKFPVRARTLAELQAMAEPQAVQGGQSEAIPAILFDTATYVDNTTTQLTFFTTTRATPQLSNLNGRGLPTPQYFEAYYAGCDLLQPAGNIDALTDASLVMNGTGTAGQGGPTWQFELANKVTGPYPLAAFHTLGGPQGFTTRTGIEYGNFGPSDGGFCLDGAIIIPPNQTFSITLTWPAAVNIAANRDIRIWFAGVLHRRVL